MRTGRNAMRPAGIDARKGALGKRSRHRVDLLPPRILPTHADRGKAIVRPIVRPSAGWRWCAVGRHPPGEIIGRGRYISYRYLYACDTSPYRGACHKGSVTSCNRGVTGRRQNQHRSKLRRHDVFRAIQRVRLDLWPFGLLRL